MHEAYNQINTISAGFGVFIAGPSKTADIEQNLVIGNVLFDGTNMHKWTGKTSD